MYGFAPAKPEAQAYHRRMPVVDGVLLDNNHI